MKIPDIIQQLLTLDLTKDYDFEINEHREKRSLNANSYCWVLITKIANELKLGKEVVYQTMLQDYGQSKLLPFLPNDTPQGYCKYYDFERDGELNGKQCHWYKCYKGSSEYDSKEMAILIDGIVEEAKELGINTLTPNEISMLKENWRKK